MMALPVILGISLFAGLIYFYLPDAKLKLTAKIESIKKIAAEKKQADIDKKAKEQQFLGQRRKYRLKAAENNKLNLWQRSSPGSPPSPQRPIPPENESLGWKLRPPPPPVPPSVFSAPFINQETQTITINGRKMSVQAALNDPQIAKQVDELNKTFENQMSEFEKKLDAYKKMVNKGIR